MKKSFEREIAEKQVEYNYLRNKIQKYSELHERIKNIKLLMPLNTYVLKKLKEYVELYDYFVLSNKHMLDLF